MASELDRIIREPERLRITGRDRTSWWRDERAGRVPKRLRISSRAIGWLESEIREWMRQRAQERA